MITVPHSTPTMNELSPLLSIQEFMNRFGVSKEALDLFCSKLTERNLAKKDYFVRQGETCRHITFIHKGLMRLFYDVEGEEHVRQFHFENSFCSEYQSFLTQKPAQMSLQALEDTTLLIMSHRDMHDLFAQSKEIEQLGRILAEQAFIFVSQRFASMLLESPETRYQRLVQERPKVMQRVPQYMIASYLGITPQALSRIRKRLSEE
ncbi:MAG: Crp/Fnr family transcriptional regulator [Ignavibacteria bacterium]|nr:Crp/Fnr family transcriptional regulator [Ignavibacteria bacterium]